MIPAAIVRCAALERDLSGILARVPHAVIEEAPLTPGSHAGCIAGHQAIVRAAQRERWPAVFVIEDDCAFTAMFDLDRWEADAHWAGAHGFDVVAGGCVSTAHPRRVRQGLFAVDRFKSSHCVVYLASAYDVVLRLTEPMDLMIGRLGAKCVVTYPFVAIQQPGYSGIQRRDVDYRAMYIRHEEALGMRAS